MHRMHASTGTLYRLKEHELQIAMRSGKLLHASSYPPVSKPKSKRSPGCMLVCERYDYRLLLIASTTQSTVSVAAGRFPKPLRQRFCIQY